MPIDRTPWTDETIMPWGIHKGKAMLNVPASFLDWLRDQSWIMTWPGLQAYLKDNKTRIDKELEEEGPKDKGPNDGFDSFEDFERYG